MPPSHGGSHWFDPSTAHHSIRAFARCPADVDEGHAPYDRQAWFIDAVAICHIHRRALISTCHGCGRDREIVDPSEDKDDFVRALANGLHEEGLRVWYDEFSLRIGDSLRRKIDLGLANSRVGLVILSPSFIAKGWTNYELDGIVTKSVSGEQVLLPIWHKLTKQEVIAFSPSLADKVARSTATHTIDEIATEIADLIRTAPQ